MPRVSDRYPDYDDLTGYHYTTEQLTELLSLRANEALETGQSTYDLLVSVLELLQHGPGTFPITETGPDRGTVRLGSQVATTDGHALFVPDADELRERHEELTERQHASSDGRTVAELERSNLRFAEIERTADEPATALANDLIDIANSVDSDTDREAFHDRLFTRLSEEVDVFYLDRAAESGRLYFNKHLQGLSGTGLFRPDPEAMRDEPEPDFETDLTGVHFEDGAVVVDRAALTDGGYLALNAGSEIVGHSEYLEAGIHEDVTIPCGDGVDGSLRVMAFHGEPDVEFSFASNDPYTRNRTFLFETVEVPA